MSPAIDVSAYLRRIGHAGEVRPTLETLRKLVARHVRAIPFENLNPLLGLPVLLDPASLERKLIHEGRGGYCFEQNLLLKGVLETIGFQVQGLSARVLWDQPESAVTARSHMLLRVEIDGQSYVVDVGFGGVTLTGVLCLEPGVEQATPHEPFRLIETPGYFRMQAPIQGEWRTLYRFDLSEQFLPDYEIYSYYLSTNSRSYFKAVLMAARVEADRRYALLNNRLTIHYLSGASEQRILANAAELRQALEQDLLIKLPDSPELEPLLAQLSQKAGA